MNRFLLIANTGKEEAVLACKEFGDFLQKKENVWVTENPSEADCIITFGGDGTIIRAARDYAAYELPILGVNMGTLGYLAELSKEDLEQALERMLSEDFLVEERMMLTGKVIRNGAIIYENSGLNDIVLHAINDSNALNFEVSVNNEPLIQYIADGIILSTPTGSTAYNLSAGGPIVMPSGEMMVATPICPHTLVNRAIVFPGDATISICLTAREQEAALRCDSDAFNQIQLGDRIIVSKAEKKVRLIKFEQNSFIEVLRNKLKG